MVRVAVIGLVGRSMFFDVPRFHAGGETIVARGYHEEWGGKGFNQAVAAARQGASVAFLGACAAADAGAIADFARGEGVAATLCAKARPTASAAILTDDAGETRVTVYPGAALASEDVAGFAEAIAAADVLLLNNEVPEAVNLAAVAVARRGGVKVVLNPAPARLLPKEILEAVSLFTPNAFEEKALLENFSLFASDFSLFASNFSLFTFHSSLESGVVVTLGSRGCRVGATGEVIPAPRVAAVDATGAGDTFTAVLSVRLAEGAALRDACVAANAAASESVTKRFVMPAIPHRRRTAARACEGV